MNPLIREFFPPQHCCDGLVRQPVQVVRADTLRIKLHPHQGTFYLLPPAAAEG
jgi:hypothetical protein